MKYFIFFVALCLPMVFAQKNNQLKAKCDLRRGDKLLGTIKLCETHNATFDGLRVFGKLDLPDLADGLYGFHVHQEGKLGNNCLESGGHYNPFNQTHGAPNNKIRHLGDLGNIQVIKHVANIEIFDKLLSLKGKNSILNRAIVLHAGKDDLGLGKDAGSKASGNAGSRFSCCVITKVD